MPSPSKYAPAKLPETAEEALAMAVVYETSARQARDRDLPGSARHLELMALLLQHYAATMNETLEQFMLRSAKRGVDK